MKKIVCLTYHVHFSLIPALNIIHLVPSDSLGSQLPFDACPVVKDIKIKYKNVNTGLFTHTSPLSILKGVITIFVFRQMLFSLVCINKN